MRREINGRFFLRIAISLCFLAISLWELFFLQFSEQPQVDFPWVTRFFYLSIFMIFAIYARISFPLVPLMRFRFFLIFLFFIAVLLIYFRGEADAEDALSYRRFMLLHAFLSVLYFLFFSVLIFGDDFIWPISRILKFGRKFRRH